MCGAYALTRFSSDHEEDGLMSPLKQMYFLLGLMLSTSEPENPARFGPDEWRRSVELLDSIFASYARMYFPNEEDLSGLSEQWWKVREVAMPAFLHHFNTGMLASVEQLAGRIRRYISPFDETLAAQIGVSASDALAITNWISMSLQTAADELVEARRARTAVLTLFERAIIAGRSMNEAKREVERFEHRSLSDELPSRLENFLKVHLGALSEHFGPTTANAYWNSFVSKRGEAARFNYLTERNPAEERPLFQLQDGVAFCPLINALYSAILTVAEDRLLASEVRESFLRHRDKALEREVEEVLTRLLGESGHFYAGVFETSTLQYEHDLVVRWEDYVFVVEAKASPPIEPFRDPEQSFTRLRRAFHSDRGLQKAFDQGNRIRRQLRSGKAVHLYNSEREHVTTIEPNELERTYLICVTRDDFGPLALNLSLLLEKDEEDPYPWVINILDLHNLVDAWDYFGWGVNQLVRYLDLRIGLHGKVYASDELEIAGFFIKHGGLEPLVAAEADLIQLVTSYSDVFDDIYWARQGGEEVIYAPTEPFMGDMSQMLRGDGESEPTP